MLSQAITQRIEIWAIDKLVSTPEILAENRTRPGRQDPASQSGAKIEVAIVTEGRSAFITVRANGPGIPHDELNSIFAPF